MGFTLLDLQRLVSFPEGQCNHSLDSSLVMPFLDTGRSSAEDGLCFKAQVGTVNEIVLGCRFLLSSGRVKFVVDRESLVLHGVPEVL